MQHHLAASGRTVEDVAEVVVRSRGRARGNPLAPYAAPMTVRDVLEARPVATPVTDPMMARGADAAVVVVLGAADVVRSTARKPVRLAGTGWCSGNSLLEHRDHARSEGTSGAAKMAYQEAGIVDPRGTFDAIYVSDLFAHRQGMHLDAMGLAGESPERVNPDGGSLAGGDLFEATGGARLFDAVQQLRGEAGAHQIPGASRAVVQAWRGLPTDSCAVVVLDIEAEGRVA
jgi:acetyl-CoA acetyltransferase